MSIDTLIKELRGAAKPVKVFAGVDARGAVYRNDKPANAQLLKAAADSIASTQAEILRLRQRVAALEQSLAPFAQRAFIFDGMDDEFFCQPSVQVKHLRAARGEISDGGAK